MAMLVGAFIGIAAVPSSATPACGFTGAVVTVSLPSDGDAALVAVGAGMNDDRILFGVSDATLAPCGTATVGNTDTVGVTGGIGAQTFRVSLAGGPFGPGMTAEADGTSEIEFAIDLGEGDDDRVIVAGGGDADWIVAGSGGVNVNAVESPDDADVQLVGVEELDLEGARDDDTLSAAGGEGTGDPFGAASLEVRGGEDDDQLTGGPGDDVLNGGPGSDALDGGPGVDTASFSAASAGVVASLASGSASGGDGSDTLAAIENLTGSAFDDELTGDDGDNVLNGLAGNDAIAGGAGTDAAWYAAATAGVTVDLAAGTATGGDGTDTLEEIENVLGSAFDDVLRGDAGANQLIGAGGEDVLSGGGANDRLLGGDDPDTIRGGGGNDGILGQAGDDELRGGSGNDGMRGGGGADLLSGGGGNDVLRGGPLSDMCSGGAGTDEIHSCEA